MGKYRNISSVLSGLIALAVLSNFFIGLQRTTTLERKGSGAAREALAGPHLLIQREQNTATLVSSTFPKSNDGKEQAIPVTKAPKPATMSSIPAFLRGVDPSKIEARRKQALFRLKMLQNYTRPDLEDLVDSEKNEIIGDVQFLLDFAVVGHGKCGTTTLMHWLADHPEIQCFREEIWELMFSRPAGLVSMLYLELPPGRYKRGYKAPGDITQPHVLEYFRKYFSKTRLIIGVRHPVLWFESLYNFRVQNLADEDYMMEPNKLIGKCSKGTHQTCTEKANFAYNLLMLGKSNYNKTARRHSTDLEEEIVGHFRRSWFNVSEVPYMENPVFLFEIGQLSDSDESRNVAFRKDMQNFLGLQMELADIGHHTPGRSWAEEKQRKKDKNKIDICDAVHEPVRKELLRLGRLGSRWIREVFLGSRGVVVSSRPYLEGLLRRWEHDPCENRGV